MKTGVYKVIKERPFGVPNAAFTAGIGTKVLAIQVDEGGRKILLDFGKGLVWWFDHMVMNDIEFVCDFEEFMDV